MRRDLTTAAAGAPTVTGRTLRGLIAPFGVAGMTSTGRLTFDAQSLRVTEARRVPLLVEHDQRTAVGHATDFETTDAGIYATFEVEDSTAGDQALAQAAAGSRWGLSVGVILDDEVATAQARNPRTPALARGALREVSLVSVPAFDDARVTDASAPAARTTAATIPAGLAGGSPQGEAPMSKQLAQTTQPASTLTTASAVLPDPTITVATTPTTVPTPAQTPPAGEGEQGTEEQPTAAAAAGTSTASGQGTSTAAGTTTGPQVVPATAGVQHVTEASVYADGGEHSFVRDAFRARMEGDAEAAARLAKFNAQLTEAAVAVRSGFGEIIPPGYRGEMMVRAIDRGRPIVSRLDGITLTDATPFKIPVEGEFEGVGDHVEGTAHVAAGTLTVDEETVNPKAISGAFEVSRELVDASNPAIDRIALNAMLRDYRRKTENYAVTAYTGSSPITVTRGRDLELQLLDFLDDRDASPAFVASAPGFFGPIATEEAGDGRPRYPYLGPTNASGTSAAGFTGVNVQGVPLVRAGSVGTAQALAIMPEDVLWGESRVATFRFDEVLGPGVIKLALFSYVAAKVLRASGVKTYTYAAPAPEGD